MGFVNIYYQNISEYKEEDLEKIRAMISPKRREIMDRRKSQKDKIRTGMCEVLLWKGLVEIGVDISELEVSYGEAKPQLRNLFLKNRAEFGDSHVGNFASSKDSHAGESIGLDFSFSHAGDYVFCAISDCSIGVDVEAVREKMPINSSHVLSEKELEEVESSENPKYEFLKYWTCKEAFIKCAYPEKVNFRSGELDFSQLPYAMSFAADKTLENYSDFYFATYDLDETYRFSFCAKTDENFFLNIKNI